MASTDWRTLAKNHIVGRDWGSIRNTASAAAVGYRSHEAIELSQTVNELIGERGDGQDRFFVFGLPGARVASLHDAVASCIRCAYLLRATGNCLLGGQPTWAAVDAYHFSLLACRAILGLLGLHFVDVGGTHCVLDVHPHGIHEHIVKAFLKEHGKVDSPVRLVYRARGQVIVQQDMWVILGRALRTLKADGLGPETQRDIKKICDLEAGFGAARNKILYTNEGWLYEEDFEKPCGPLDIQDEIYEYDDEENLFRSVRDANFAFARLVARLLTVLLRAIEDQAGSELVRTSYRVCLTEFTGFNFDRMDALYATMYQKSAYGAGL